MASQSSLGLLKQDSYRMNPIREPVDHESALQAYVDSMYHARRLINEAARLSPTQAGAGLVSYAGVLVAYARELREGWDLGMDTSDNLRPAPTGGWTEESKEPLGFVLPG